MSAPPRRFFWGRTLAQALAKAARHHGVAPERIAYAVLEKRHGFVKHPRAVIVEVDPERPTRSSAEPPAKASPAAAAPPVAPSPPAPPSPPRVEPKPGPPPGARQVTAEEDGFDAPDAESEIAAVEAANRLLAFAGLDLAPSVRRGDDALEVELDGPDRERLAAGGVELLDAFEALLPRVVVALSGRRVHCRVDGAGLRGRREREIEALVEQAVARAREDGEHLLAPLPPAERRLVHLMLRDAPGLATESLGRGLHKRLRIYLTDENRAG